MFHTVSQESYREYFLECIQIQSLRTSQLRPEDQLRPEIRVFSLDLFSTCSLLRLILTAGWFCWLLISVVVSFSESETARGPHVKAHTQHFVFQCLKVRLHSVRQILISGKIAWFAGKTRLPGSTSPQQGAAWRSAPGDCTVDIGPLYYCCSAPQYSSYLGESLTVSALVGSRTQPSTTESNRLETPFCLLAARTPACEIRPANWMFQLGIWENDTKTEELWVYSPWWNQEPNSTASWTNRGTNGKCGDQIRPVCDMALPAFSTAWDPMTSYPFFNFPFNSVNGQICLKLECGPHGPWLCDPEQVI